MKKKGGANQRPLELRKAGASVHGVAAKREPGEKLRKSDATRARILGAAHRVLRDKDYQAARLSDIARAANTHAGAMYYYFDSKQSLVAALVEQHARQHVESVQDHLAALRAGASAGDKLRAAITVYMQHVGDKSNELAAVARLMSNIPPELRKRAFVENKTYRRLYSDIIREGQASGEFRPDIDPTVAALALIGSLVWCFEWYRPGRWPLSFIIEQIHGTFVRGIERSRRARSTPTRSPR